MRHAPAINGEIHLKLVFEFIDQDLATYLEGCPAPGLGPDRIKVEYNMSLVARKPVFGVSDQVRHKPGCTAIEDS